MRIKPPTLRHHSANLDVIHRQYQSTPSVIFIKSIACKDGGLVKLLDGWIAPPEIIHVVFPSRRGLLPSVRALIDFLAERYASFNEE